MSDDAGSHSHLRFADFLTGLRAELSRAQAQAEEDGLRFGIDQITVELDLFCDPASSDASRRRSTMEFRVGVPWVQDNARAGQVPTQRVSVRLSPRPARLEADVDEDIPAPAPLLPPPLRDRRFR